MKNKKILATLAVAVLAATALGGAASAVDDSKEVRQSDFIAGLADVRSAGHVDFLEEGLHVFTDDNTSQAKAAEYFAPRASTGTAIPDTYTQDWYGTTPEPGKQIVFDTDGDRSNAGSFNILVGEPVYGDDWWQSGGQARAAANGYTCPETGGGFGGDCHGTLAQWKAALATDKPSAEVYAYGFSLGSGVKGDGVLRAQTIDGDEYIFTDEDATPAPVTPEAHTATGPVTAPAPTYEGSGNRVFVGHLRTNTIPANDTGRGTKVHWTVKVDGSTTLDTTQGWGDGLGYRVTFPKGKSHTVTIYKSNVKIATKTVTAH